MTIPIMHCFDDHYAAPAAVAFLSLLEQADRSHDYALYVVTEDVSQRHRAMLQEVVGRFPNATLEFLPPPVDAESLFRQMNTVGHYSKEVLYKMLVADLFPQYGHVIVSDVDVVYQADVSKTFLEFLKEDSCWIAGVGYCHADLPCAWIEQVFDNCYAEDFSAEERQRLTGGVGGGYLICNLERMRAEQATERMLEVFRLNAPRLKQAEQDAINLACHGHLKRLPIRNMVSNCFYEHLTETEKPLWADALAHPVQLHYVSNVKPWNSPGCAMAHIWWRYLADTPFFYEVARPFDREEKISVCTLFGFLRLAKIWHTGAIHKVCLLNSIPMRTRTRC